MALCSSREIIALKLEEEKIVLGLQFIIPDRMSLVIPPDSNGRTKKNFCPGKM
jgi:hypothetical protein